EYAYTYYENYQGAYWTSTVRNAEEGKVYWLPMMCNGCTGNNENWGRGSHGWWENGRYGHSVRLVHIIPRQYTVTYTAGEGEGTVPVDGAKYLDGAVITLAEATGLSKEGYRFAGWKFKGQVYTDSYTINNVLANEEIVFEAQWEVDWQTVRTDLTAGNYYTICYPKAMTDVQGATLWSFVGKDANFAYIEQETATTIEAGKPYIMYATASTVTAVLGDETNAPGANGAIHGTFSDLTQDQLNNYATVAGHDLYLVIGNQLRKATGYANDGITPLTGNSLPANRAFVVLGDIPAASAHMPAHVRAMPLHKDTATGMDELNASETPVKVMINGQMYILRGEKMYDATGRLVK
ncbi:MAG: InlB B-repeat-containing protein, partial [Paludibacteraceae bacterium]|nr:InlB B-repeat-containing protein [Paludibacteraceae bacterium]